jgi:hypothetical protein
MNPGTYKHLMELPEIVLDEKIVLPDEQLATGEVSDPNQNRETASVETSSTGNGFAASGPPNAEGQGRPEQGGGDPAGGQGGFDPAAMVDRTFSRYDTNGDGQIDQGEFGQVDERARDRLSQADSNGDGRVTREEVLDGVSRMMERFQSGGPGGPGSGGREGGPGGEAR